MWNKSRYVLPVLFVVILAYQLRAQFFGPSLMVPPVTATRPPSSVADPDDSNVESQITGEFRKLCNALVAAARKSGREPPGTLAEALAAADRDWQDKRESPQEAFRWLRNGQSAGTDPWGQTCLYHVDPEGREITLRSIGPNGKNDEADPESEDYDDIVVTDHYGNPEQP